MSGTSETALLAELALESTEAAQAEALLKPGEDHDEKAKDAEAPDEAEAPDDSELKESAPAPARGRSESRSPFRFSRASSQTGGKKEAATTKVATPKRTFSFRKSKESKEPTVGEVLEGFSEPSREPVVRKTSFKKIKGFLTGGSKRRSRRASKQGKAKDDSTPKTIDEPEFPLPADSVDDDVSTVNINLDDRSVANSTVVSSTKIPNTDRAYLLRTVLLLMDANSRRFELLELEFDSEKALVADVLSQIPISVTEESLREQEYEAIITITGENMIPEKRLADFCKGSDILVAVPKGLSPEDAHRLAKPILSNAKVVGMLKSSGIDVHAIKTMKSQDQLGVDKADWASPSDKAGQTKKSTPIGGSLVFLAIVVAMAALVASFVHKSITTPIHPGQVVSPGIVLSKCGLNFSSSCEKAHLEVQPGIVSYYEDKELAWVIHGSVCPDDRIKDKTCINGLEFKEDRTLWLGGDPVKWLERHSQTGPKDAIMAYLVPWPFSEEPKIKSWVVTSNKAKNGAADAKKAAGKFNNKIKNGGATK